jgi:UDP-glucose:(heptosyl)LPS alpha-1,3-glucosyltransferase
MATPPPRLRLAVVSPFIDKRHGTERRVAECVSHLARDFEIHVYSQRVEDVPLESITWHRIPAIPGPHIFGYLWWFAANHFWRWRDAHFHGLRFDVIYSPGINCLDANAVTVHVVFAEMRRRLRDELRLCNNPMRSWARVIHRRLYYLLIGALENRIYRHRNLVIGVVSSQVDGELARHFGCSENVEVIYHGVDTNVFSPEMRARRRVETRQRLGLRDDEIVLLLVGNGWRNKGLPCLLEALARLHDLPVRLLIVGQDDRAPFDDMATRLNVSAHILFLAPSPDVAQFYAACDVYTGPSLHDSFAMPPAEAMACGVAVITSRNNGGSEIITHGENGLILEDAGDSAALAELIRSLCENSRLREQLGADAALTAAQFTWDHNAQRMREFFTRAISARNRQCITPMSSPK